MEKERITSQTGGTREKLGERWDLIPHRGLLWVAKVFDHGAKKYGANNWQFFDFKGDQCPISHGINHAVCAGRYPEGSRQRIWHLAKAAWNILVQIWHEDQIYEKNK